MAEKHIMVTVSMDIVVSMECKDTDDPFEVQERAAEKVMDDLSLCMAPCNFILNDMECTATEEV